MNTFYIVCGWDDYYPLEGLRNIKLVTFNRDEAEAYVEEQMKLKDHQRPENFEVYTSDQLPWAGPDYVSPNYEGGF